MLITSLFPQIKKEFVGRKRGEDMISNPLYNYMLGYIYFLTWKKFARLYPKAHRGRAAAKDLKRIWKEKGIKTKKFLDKMQFPPLGDSKLSPIIASDELFSAERIKKTVVSINRGSLNTKDTANFKRISIRENSSKVLISSNNSDSKEKKQSAQPTILLRELQSIRTMNYNRLMKEPNVDDEGNIHRDDSQMKNANFERNLFQIDHIVEFYVPSFV